MPIRIISFQLARPKFPKLQNTAVATWVESAKYCKNVVPAPKSDDIATPARIITWELKFFILEILITIDIATTDATNAQNVTMYGDIMYTASLDPDWKEPPPRTIIPKFAPKAAALVTPIVEGDASGFFKLFCIMQPETPSEAPANTLATILGSLIFHKTMSRPLSPLFFTSKDIMVLKSISATPVFRAKYIENKINAKNINNITIFLFLYFEYSSCIFFKTHLYKLAEIGITTLLFLKSIISTSQS